jgi:hypothetical protein
MAPGKKGETKMKTLKTMILSPGAVVLLGASYAPQAAAAVQNANRRMR